MSAPSAWVIETALSAWQSARARLLADDTDLAHDEAALSVLLGPETGDVDDILARLLRGAQHATDMAEAASARAADIKAREARYKRRAETMRGTAFAIMDAVGRRKVELPDMTATIRIGPPSAVITDEAALTDAYIRITRSPDKAAILADLKQGVVIDGAQLSNGTYSLTIRSK